MEDYLILKKFLEDKLLTKTEFSEKIGVSQTTVISITNGKVPFSKKVKKKIIDNYPEFLKYLSSNGAFLSVDFEDKNIKKEEIKTENTENDKSDLIFYKEIILQNKELLAQNKELLNQHRELITQNGKLIEMLSGKDTIKKNPDTSNEGERLGKAREKDQFPTAA